jgi:DNA polymerase-3 subunit gamma/tau
MVGQDAVSRTLKNEVAGNMLSHAYLFCGTRGTGKTSSAKILARAVNCKNPQDGNPCCQCEICRGIEDETLLDVTEIDAASNSGVDSIRELRGEARFTPAATRYRVYIIDETHMLSQGAWGALLKILEEPPAHVIFILATTELHKVPATILSRCQRFDFSRIDSEVIAKRLIYIAGEESIPLAQDAALLIAKLADGGMRDALSLLDLVSSMEGEITSEAVTSRLGLLGRDHLFSLAEAVFSRDAGAVLQAAKGLWDQSVDYQRLCEQLTGFFRDIMVAKSVQNPGGLIFCLPEELPRYRALAARQSLSDILRCLKLLQEALGRISRSGQRRVELEMALLRMAEPAAEDEPLPAAREKSTAPQPQSRRPQSGADACAPAEEDAKATAEKIPMEPLFDWDKVLTQLSAKNKALHATLIGSKAYAGGDLLLVDAGANSMFARMVRGDSYAKDSLRGAVLEVTGKKYRLGPYHPERYEVRQKKDPLADLLVRASELGVSVEVKE